MFDFLKNIGNGIIQPITDVVSEFVEDPDKKNALAQKLKMAVMSQVSKELEAKRDIIVAEAKSEHWLTANWRPLSMVSFVVMLLTYWWGLAPEYIVNNEKVVEWLMEIIKFGLGGYVLGRSGEKIAKDYFKTKVK